MPDLRQRGLPGAATAGALVEAARDHAHELLGGLGARWRHTQGVARAATAVMVAVPAEDQPVLLAAAWLHDIGYAPELRRSGFHPLDGAWHLHERRWPEPVPGLVAHHSAAGLVAAVRGLARPMKCFPAARYAYGPVADALTFADQTTGPDGEVIGVEERLADMLRRHGPDSPNVRAHDRRAPAIRAAIHGTEQRLRGDLIHPTVAKPTDA